MQTLWQNLRYGVRVLLKNPGFTLIALMTLALGIGATTAIFSITKTVILNPFPYRHPDGLYMLRQSLPKTGVTNQVRSSGPEFEEVAASQIFEQVAGLEPVSRNLTGSEQPERIGAAKVTGDFFALLGVDPLLGRAIQAEDVGPKGERVLVIGYGLWQRRFGGERSVLGQKVALDDESYTIIGVMPPRFRFDAAEAWFPFPFELRQLPRSNRFVAVIGRLKREVKPRQVEAQLEVLARQQEQDYLSTNPEYAGRTYTVQHISEFYVGMVKTVVLTLLGAVGLVLLIACANIANLLLARARNRTRELAIRSALGASRLQLIGQMMTESMILAVVGGGGGVLLAVWGIDALAALIPKGSIPRELTFEVDSTVLLFALATSVFAALVFGLWPALRTSKPDVQETMKSGAQRTTAGQRHRKAQRVLVVVEVSLSLVLLVMAGLMIRSFARLMQIDSGFRTENVLSMRINRSPARTDGGKQMGPFFQQLIDQVKTVPGIEAVAVASHMPFVMTENWSLSVDSNSVPPEMQTQDINTRTISADYFQVLGIPFIAGEAFIPQETSAVVIINQTLAHRYWPNESAIGKRLKIGAPDSKNPWFMVKGVVADSAQADLDSQIQPEAYFTLSQTAFRYRRMNLIVRTNSDPRVLLGSIQEKINEVDRDQPVYQVQTLGELVSDSVGPRRIAMTLLILFAGLAVVLAFIGIYGVMSYGVTERTNEIGIRLALGAERCDVIKLILREGLMTSAIGVAIGLLAALVVTRFMSSLLFGVSATDWLTFIAITITLMMVALVACYIPARKATELDPIAALRYE